MKQKQKRKRRHNRLDDELVALVVYDDSGLVGPFTLPADIAPEARVPGINPVAVEDQDDLFPELIPDQRR